MLLPIKLICKKTQSRRDGTAIIKIQYCYTSEKRTELPTEIAIPPEYWNRKSRRISDKLPEKFGSPTELNGKLQTMLRIAQDIVTFAISRKIADPLLFVKNTFRPDFDPQTLYENEKVVITQAQTNTDLFYQFDDFITSKKKKVSKSLLNIFNASKECILAYQHHTGTPITFDSFDFASVKAILNF